MIGLDQSATDFDYTNDNVGNRIKYDYSRMDKDAILYELSMIDWHILFKGSVSDCWEVFKECILNLQQRFVPQMNCDNRGKVKKIWMSHRAVKLIKKKHKV